MQADMCYLPLANKVDAVWACASMLHLSREAFSQALVEVLRTLRSGGYFLLKLKRGTGEVWKDDSADGTTPRFFTYWQEDELDDRLLAAGFVINEARQSKLSVRGDSWLHRLVQKPSI